MLIAAQILMTCVVREEEEWNDNGNCEYNTVHMHASLTINKE